MIARDTAKTGTIYRIYVMFVDAVGVPKSGIIPEINLQRSSDGKFYDTSDGWQTSATSKPAMLPANASNLPGVYYYDFTVPAVSGISYVFRCDGGSQCSPQYEYRWVLSVASDENDIAAIKTRIDGLPTVISIVQDDTASEVDIYQNSTGPAVVWPAFDENTGEDWQLDVCPVLGGDPIFQLSTGSGLSETGSNGAVIITATYDDADTAVAGTYRYWLWMLGDTEDKVKATGLWIIAPTSKYTPPPA